MASLLLTATGTQYGLAQTGLTPTSGVTYTLSAWVNRTETVDSWKLQFSGANLTGSTNIPAVTGWQRVTVTATATATAAMVVRVINFSAGAATAIYIDGFQVETGSVATPYIETDGATATRSAATVQASSSVLNATSGWVATRVRLGFGVAANEPPTFAPVFRWGSSAGNEIFLFYRSSSNNWEVKFAGTAGGRQQLQ